MVNTEGHRAHNCELLFASLPQDAPQFQSHWSKPYTGQPYRTTETLCLGPCYTGDPDCPVGHVRRLPTELLHQYHKRIYFLQAAWTHQQATLFRICFQMEASGSVAAFPYNTVFAPNYARRIHNNPWTMVHMPSDTL